MQRSVVAVGVAVACAAAPGAAVAADVIYSGTTGRHGAVSVVERGRTLRLSINDRPTYTSVYRFGRIRCASRGVSFRAGRSDLPPAEVGSLRR